VTGHLPATETLETLPEGIRQSPTTCRQDYEFRLPAKEFWRNRSFQAQRPSGGVRDGVLNPANQTLMRNFQDVQVLVQ
jgi:hypothetical protein